MTEEKSEERERKLFEAAFGPYGLSRCNAPGDDLGGYQDAHINFAWRAWKARAALSTKQDARGYHHCLACDTTYYGTEAEHIAKVHPHLSTKQDAEGRELTAQDRQVFDKALRASVTVVATPPSVRSQALEKVPSDVERMREKAAQVADAAERGHLADADNPCLQPFTKDRHRWQAATAGDIADDIRALPPSNAAG